VKGVLLLREGKGREGKGWKGREGEWMGKKEKGKGREEREVREGMCPPNVLDQPVKLVVFMHQVITQRCAPYVTDLFAFCASDPTVSALGVDLCTTYMYVH